MSNGRSIFYKMNFLSYLGDPTLPCIRWENISLNGGGKMLYGLR